MKKTAIIIGAGPAGLTAAYELATRAGVKPILFEESDFVGGISRTVEYRGNRMDIGGHRFFSKSDRVVDWWFKFMPLQGAPTREDKALGRAPCQFDGGAHGGRERSDPEATDLVMLVRNRLSRIFFLRRFFSYPITLSGSTLRNLGAVRTLKIGLSYMKARLFPIRKERSLEDFFINRFGRELYLTFFKDYTEKVWGYPCDGISPEWGAQRVKGLSISKAIAHAAKKLFARDNSVAQKNTETSLIERFLYPKLGPGQMWEAVACEAVAAGAEIHMRKRVVGLRREGERISGAIVKDLATGVEHEVKGDFFFSTMPVKDLVAGLSGPVPDEVKGVAAGLEYRDFITVGLLLRKLAIRNNTPGQTLGDIVPDNWIYIQERDVKVGRLQIFNNWSPYMVSDPSTVFLGLEYFCNEGDGLWTMADDDFKRMAVAEMAKIGIVDPADVLDSCIVRVPNLFLIGRNGMHRYNNQDHSMLTAMTAVDNIVAGISSKENIWGVNAEEEYHEEKR